MEKKRVWNSVEVKKGGYGYVEGRLDVGITKPVSIGGKKKKPHHQVGHKEKKSKNQMRSPRAIENSDRVRLSKKERGVGLRPKRKKMTRLCLNNTIRKGQRSVKGRKTNDIVGEGRGLYNLKGKLSKKL